MYTAKLFATRKKENPLDLQILHSSGIAILSKLLEQLLRLASMRIHLMDLDYKNLYSKMKKALYALYVCLFFVNENFCPVMIKLLRLDELC